MNRTTAKNGFTILEVLIALSILAVGIVAILQLFPVSMRQQHAAAERTAIASLARSELGRVRAGGVYEQDDLKGFMQRWIIDNAFRSLDEVQRAYSLYDGWRASIAPVSSAFGDEVSLFRVTFSVSMLDGQEEKFVTYVTEL